MSAKNGYLQQKGTDFTLLPQTKTSLVYDVDRAQALMASLKNLAEKQCLGYPSFTTTDDWNVGDKCFHDRRLWKFKNAHAAGAWNDADVDPWSVKDELNELLIFVVATFAQKDGYYATLIAGAAENLVGRGSVGAEYRFRPTAGSGSVGSGAAKITKMLGNTLVWNQLVNNGNFANGTTGWLAGNSTINAASGVLTITPTARYGNVRRACNLVVGHKYCIIAQLKADNAEQEVSIGLGQADHFLAQGVVKSFVSPTDWTNVLFRGTYNETGFTATNREIIIMNTNITSNFGNIYVRNVMVFDLTLMFGEGNEPTAAQFEAMYPLDYYAYNAGTLINNEATGIKTVGFNQWDEEWEEGVIDNDTGNNFDASDRVRSKNHIRVISGQTYYIKAPSGRGLYLYCYDNNKQYIGRALGINSFSNTTVTIPAGCGYIRFTVSAGYTTYNNDICINLSWSGYRNGEYEAYWESLLDLNLKTLTGKLNGEGESVVVRPNGFEAVGTTADEGIVEGGNLTKINVKIGNQVINGAIGDTITLEGCKTSATSFLCASDIGTLSDGVLTLTAAATNVEVYYPLAVPMTYILDTPVPVVYREDDFGTEERLPADTASAVTAPIKYEVAYPMNAVDEIRNLPANYVSGKEVQTFTTAEKEQARQNIGAASLADVQAMFAALPTTDPQVAGELWNDNGTVKISAGTEPVEEV